MKNWAWVKSQIRFGNEIKRGWDINSKGEKQGVETLNDRTWRETFQEFKRWKGLEFDAKTWKLETEIWRNNR